MAETPSDIEQVIEQVRAILVQWQVEGKLGEVAVLVGGNQYQPEERPRIKRDAVKREQPGRVPIVRMG